MGRILEAFLNDQLHLDDMTEKDNPEYLKFSEKAFELQKKLEENLSDEEKELLQHLMETLFEGGISYANNRYVRGYQLGVLMTMEVFEARDALLAI